MRHSWIFALALLLAYPMFWAQAEEGRDAKKAAAAKAAPSDEDAAAEEEAADEEAADEEAADEDAAEDEAPADGDAPADEDAEAGSEEVEAIELNDPETTELLKKISYIFGANVGRNIKGEGLDLDMKVFVEGLNDMVEGRKPRYDTKEMQETMQAFEAKMMARRAEQTKLEGAKNKLAGEAFLTANKKKKGVKTLPSGLQYRVLKSGSGKSPKRTDIVTTHYKGTLIDGTVFDSSFDRKMEATFPVEGVIPGWVEALQLMHEGDQWELVVPANLAYGADSRGPVIGPHSTLVFEIHLLKVGK